jgi:hypothetical protein
MSIKRLSFFVARPDLSQLSRFRLAVSLVNAGYGVLPRRANAAVDFRCDSERSCRCCGESWKRFTHRTPARGVAPRERRADHELSLVEQHQGDDNEAHMPGEQQGCNRHAVDEAFL